MGRCWGICFEGLEELQEGFGVVQESCSEWAWREKCFPHPSLEEHPGSIFLFIKGSKKRLVF